jgi:hypothetical protein
VDVHFAPTAGAWKRVVAVCELLNLVSCGRYTLNGLEFVAFVLAAARAGRSTDIVSMARFIYYPVFPSGLGDT